MCSEEEFADSPNGKWLGYELHDGLLQWLVGARMSLEASLEPVRDSVPRAAAEATLDSLVAAIDEGRMLISFLEEHSEHKCIDLVEAIRHCLIQLVPPGAGEPPELQLELHCQAVMLPQPIGWNVLRIVQQAYRNAIVHASARLVSVTCQQEQGRVILKVTDDGCGFDVARQERLASHFGLASMKHRARLLDAELTVDSKLGCGAQVRLVVPLPG